MRVLLGCSLGGLGHLTPIVVAAQALDRLGHDTLVLVPPSLRDAAADAGVMFRVGAEPPRSVIDELWAEVRAGPRTQSRVCWIASCFADRCTEAMLAAASDVCKGWRPQLVVREPCEYATAVLAHHAGIPLVQVGISQSAIEHDVLERVLETLQRHARGVAGTIAAAAYLTSFPASLDPSPWQDTRRFRQPRSESGPLPNWWPNDRRPLVYVTFGSVLGHLPEAQAVFRTALDAVADLPARVLMTVGRSVDPATLGPVAPNTHIERWVPQQDVFRHARLVVCHGGSGTTLGALAAGLPIVICPLFADQSANARLVEQAGAGVALTQRERKAGGLQSLGPDDAAPLRRMIEAVLAEPQHRQAATRIASEIALTPTLDEALATLVSQNTIR